MSDRHHILGEKINELARTVRGQTPMFPEESELDELESYLEDVESDLEAAKEAMERRKQELGENDE